MMKVIGNSENASMIYVDIHLSNKLTMFSTLDIINSEHIY